MRARSPQFYVYLFALQFNRIALIELDFISEPAASVLRGQHLISVSIMSSHVKHAISGG